MFDARDGITRRAERLRRRALRARHKQKARKELVAYRELVALTERPSDYVRYGAALSRAGASDRAAHAYKQAIYGFRQRGEDKRAAVVSGLLHGHTGQARGVSDARVA